MRLLRRCLVCSIAFVWLTASAGAVAQAPPDQAAEFSKKLEAAKSQMDADPVAGMQTLDQLAAESINIRRGRSLTDTERAAHRELFLARGRGHLQLLDNEGFENDLRELLRIDPLFKAPLSPREEEILTALRAREGGSIEVTSAVEGAKIFVNGLEVGLTSAVPTRVELLAGEYEIRLEKEGYQPATSRITVPKGEMLALRDIVPLLRVPPVAFLSDREGAEVIVDSVPVGRTQSLTTLRTQLQPEETAALDRAASSSGLGPNAAAVLVKQVPIDKPVAVQFRRECYVDASRTITVTAARLTGLAPNEPILFLGEPTTVKMESDVGKLRISSTPSDADVIIDNQLTGRTPFERDVCAGQRRVRVRHRVGSYNSTIVVRRGATESIDAVLKPNLAFLGGVDASEATPKTLKDLGQTVERSLASTVTGFRLTEATELGPDQAWPETSTLELVAAQDHNDAAAVTRLLRQASDRFDASLFVTAVKRPAAGGDSPVDLLVFWIDHPGADKLRWFPSKQSDPAPLLTRLDAPKDVADLTHRRVLSMQVGDTMLSEAPVMVVRIEPGSPAATALRVGDHIAAVDGSPITATQFVDRVNQKRPGELITLRAIRSGTPPRELPLPIQQVPALAPVFDPDLLGNVLIAKLTTAQATTANESDRALYGFNLAMTRMRFGEWKAALDLLTGLSAPPVGIGVGPAAVLFFRARCHEELGEADRATALYREASGMEGQLMTPDGTTVASLARRRLVALGQGPPRKTQ